MGLRGRGGEIPLADQIAGQAGGDLREMLPAVRAPVEAAVLRAADDRPRLPLEPRHPGIDDTGVARLDLDVHRADAVRHEQHLAPRLPAVARLEYPALGIRLERVAAPPNPSYSG